MAKVQKGLVGWQYTVGLGSGASIENNENTPRRSSRRGISTTSSEADQLVLRRELDNMEIKQGDCILVDTDSELPEIALIKEISFGTDYFINLKVYWFYRISEIDSTKLVDESQREGLNEDSIPEGYTTNDIFLCPSVEKILATEIINKCKVISQKTLESIVLDESNFDSTYVCRRITDTDGDYFSDFIDWDEFQQEARDDGDEFYQTMKRISADPSVSRVRKQSSVSPQKSEKKKTKDPVRSYAESDQELSFSEASETYDSEEEEDELSDDEEVLDGSPKKRKLHTLKSRKKPSPKKKKSSSPFKTAQLDYSKKHKVPELRFPTVSRRLQFDVMNSELQDEEGQEELLKTGRTTKNFRKARKKLHTSSKLQSLPCREQEFDAIYGSLETAIKAQTGCCLYVSGTPGVGKTATIREVIRQLSSELARNCNGISQFNYVEINGLKLITPQAAYELLWEKISNTSVTSAHALTLLEEHFEKNDKHRKPMVVLLDELDQIVSKNQTVMYNFFNWPSYSTSKLIVIAVANTMDLPERMLTNKISSRLGLTRIQFPGYTFNQLSEIIKHRLEKLSRVNEGKLIISKDAIEFASRKVASVSGDARRSLMICIRALEIAEMEFLCKDQETRDQLDGKYTVTIMHIMKAVNETVSSPIANYLNSLSFVSKMVLASVLLRKKRTGLAELQLGEIIDELNNQFHLIMLNDLNKILNEEQLELLKVMYGDDSRLRVSGLNFILKDLEENGIIVQQQLKAERLRLLRLSVSEDEIISCFKKDSLLKDIVIET
ncbi:hypothetical protein CANARDRAFT_30094 [[Candida] arabinofermentans NRRL YB-2248]|uniref:Origin recognition complex subunit 1 n=1 Tax=[Candida] arabinofermentans NRRL YB-2248 TaxID=983967 RepID=A0A1E4SV57_9ASCO|nr:hypothetical protein CANARDRAFT_30094 [[Candida] arabinofermentans NRRL YB-2248]